MRSSRAITAVFFSLITWFIIACAKLQFMREKIILIITLSVVISLIVLSGCLDSSPSKSPAPGGSEPADNLIAQSGAEQTSLAWIHIDPLHDITRSRIRISGTTNLPDGTQLTPRILLTFPHSINGTSGDNYKEIRRSLTVHTVDGVGVWSMTTDLDVPLQGQVIPDRCIVHVIAVPENVYATSVVPPAVPSLAKTEDSYHVRMSPLENGSLEMPFAINGTTNLPEGYILVAEIYSAVFSEQRFGSVENYQPVFMDFVTVVNPGTGNGSFSVPVNLSGKSGPKGLPLKAGDFFVEVHAINLNSTVSDSRVISLSGKKPMITIAAIGGGASQNSNLWIHGNINLRKGEKIYVHLTQVPHHCPRYFSPPDHDTQSRCGGSTCTDVDIRQTLVVQGGPENESNWWIFGTETTNWCMNEQYMIRVTAGESDRESEEIAYFHLH